MHCVTMYAIKIHLFEIILTRARQWCGICGLPVFKKGIEYMDSCLHHCFFYGESNGGHTLHWCAICFCFVSKCAANCAMVGDMFSFWLNVPIQHFSAVWKESSRNGGFA